MRRNFPPPSRMGMGIEKSLEAWGKEWGTTPCPCPTPWLSQLLGSLFLFQKKKLECMQGIGVVAKLLALQEVHIRGRMFNPQA